MASPSRQMLDEHEKLALAATKQRVSDWISSSMDIIKMRETTECPRSEISTPDEPFRRACNEERPTREKKHVGRRRTCPAEFDAKAVLRRFVEEQTLTKVVAGCDDSKETSTTKDGKCENVARKGEILDETSSRNVTSDRTAEIVGRRLNSKTSGEIPKQNATEVNAATETLLKIKDSTRKEDCLLPELAKPSERTRYSLVREIFPPQFDTNLSSTSEVSCTEDRSPFKDARDGATEPRQREKSPEMNPGSPTSENSAYYSVKSLKYNRVHTEHGNRNTDSQSKRQESEMKDASINAGICGNTAERSSLDSRWKQRRNNLHEERQQEKPQISNSGDCSIGKRQECPSQERKMERYTSGGDGNKNEGTIFNSGTTNKIDEQLLNIKQVKTGILKQCTDSLTEGSPNDKGDKLIRNRKEPQHSKVTVDVPTGSELTRTAEHIVGNAETVPAAKHVEHKLDQCLEESEGIGEKRMTESRVSGMGDYLTGKKSKKEKGAKIEETNDQEKGVRENLSVLSNMCKNLIGNVSNALNAKEVATGSKMQVKNSSYIGNDRPMEKLCRTQTDLEINSNAKERQRKERQQVNSMAAMNPENGDAKIYNNNSAEFTSKQNGCESVMRDKGIRVESKTNQRRPSSKLTDVKNKTKEAGIESYENQTTKHKVEMGTMNQGTTEKSTIVNHVKQKTKQVHFKVDTMKDVGMNEETKTESKLKESYFKGTDGKTTRDQGCGDTSIYSYMQPAPTDEARGRPIRSSEQTGRLSDMTDHFTQCDGKQLEDVDRVYPRTQIIREKTYNTVTAMGNSVTEETKHAKLTAIQADRWSTEKNCKTLIKNYSVPVTICHSSTSEMLENTSELNIDIRKVEVDSEETQHFNSPIRGPSPEKVFALQKQKTISVVNIVLGDNDADYINERNERAGSALGAKRTAQKTTHSKKTIEKAKPKSRTTITQKTDRNTGTNTSQTSVVNFKRLDKPPARSTLKTHATQSMEQDTSFEYKLIPGGLQQKLLNATSSKRTQRNVQQLVRHRDLPDREITTMVTNTQTDDLQNETSRNVPGSLQENITDFKRRLRADTNANDKQSCLRNTDKNSQPVCDILENKRREIESNFTINARNTTTGLSNTETTGLSSVTRNSTGTSTSPVRQINGKTGLQNGTQCCYKPRENKGLFNVNDSFMKDDGNGNEILRLTIETEKKSELNQKEQIRRTDGSELLPSEVSKSTLNELRRRSIATNSTNHGAGESLYKYQPSNSLYNKAIHTKPKISIRTFYSGTVLDKNPYLTNSPENNWSNSPSRKRFPAAQNRTCSVPRRELPFRVNGFASTKSNAVTSRVGGNGISNGADDVIIDITASESQTDINIRYNGECQGFADRTVNGSKGKETKQRNYYTNAQRRSRLGNL